MQATCAVKSVSARCADWVGGRQVLLDGWRASYGLLLLVIVAIGGSVALRPGCGSVVRLCSCLSGRIHISGTPELQRGLSRKSQSYVALPLTKWNGSAN